MSSRHDEHGQVDAGERDYGPEWWAQGREYCHCEHHYDQHYDAGGSCQLCDCKEFNALDNQ